MNDSRRRLLTIALGECWHSNYISANGKCYECGKIISPVDVYQDRRTFTSADDYEALRVAVIVPYKTVFHEWFKKKI